MSQEPRNIADHTDLANDDLSGPVAQNLANYIGGARQSSAANVLDVPAGDDPVSISPNAADGNILTVNVDNDIDASDILNGVEGQEFTLIMVQGATGGTVEWPTALYAGGAAPTTSATEGYHDVLTLAFDGTDWVEVSRSVGCRAPA